MIQKIKRHTLFYVFLGLIGIFLFGPLVKFFSNQVVAIEQEKERLEENERYNNSPLSDFIIIDGIVSEDIQRGALIQRNITKLEVIESVKARGPHVLKCLVDGVKKSDGYVDIGPNDYTVDIVDFDEAWVYSPPEISPRSKWGIDLNPERYNKCSTGKLYWAIDLQIIMPNGTIRFHPKFTGNVFYIND